MRTDRLRGVALLAGALVLVAAVMVLLAARSARANGRYPNASLIAFDPNDAGHFVVSATFGLLETRDGGKTFQWRCEAAFEAQAPQDVMVAITASGAMVAAKFDGIVTTRDGCSFRSAPELAGKNVVDLALRRSASHSLVSFYADPRDDGGFATQLMRSDDDGATWSPLGGLLAAELFPITVDVAPSDAARVYLSARLDGGADFGSVLLRSADGGLTFQSAAIPESTQHRLAYIAAVHPHDADVVYVRVNDPLGTRLWISQDGGVTFRKLFTGTGQLFGFAVSPDGAEVAFGGPGDGVWVGAADGADLKRRADVLPTCLAWNGDGLWACADQAVAPFFSLGLSRDGGLSFQKVLRFADLCAETGCAGDTAAGAQCGADWELIAPMVGTTCGTRGAGADAAADAGNSADGRDGGTAGAGHSSGGCGCAAAAGRGAGDAGAGIGWLLLLVVPLLVRRRTALR